MSEHDDDNLDGDVDESNLIRDLRKQLKAAKKKQDDEAAELEALRAEKRKSSIAQHVKDAGADEKYAKFYTDEDTSKEAVAKWVQANADLFGVQAPENETDPQVLEAAQRIADASAGAPAAKIGSLEAHIEAIRGAKTRDEFEAALKASNLLR